MSFPGPRILVWLSACAVGGLASWPAGAYTTEFGWSWESAGCSPSLSVRFSPAEPDATRCPASPDACNRWDISAEGCGRVHLALDGLALAGSRGVPLSSGWHDLRAEVPGAAILLRSQFLPGRNPCLQWRLRDFHLAGTIPNAILYEPPLVRWTSAFDDCLPEGCRGEEPRECRGMPVPAPLRKRYRVFLDGDFTHPAVELCDACAGGWRIPGDVWSAMAWGPHFLLIEAQLVEGGGCDGTGGGIVRAVRFVRYAFYKARAPSDLVGAGGRDWSMDRAYRLTGEVRLPCAGGCPPGAYAVEVEEGGVQAALMQAAGNFVLWSVRQGIRFTDLARLEGGAGTGRLVPRWLPVDRDEPGRPAYRNLLASAGVAGGSGAPAPDHHVVWAGRSYPHLRAIADAPIRASAVGGRDDLYVARLRFRVRGDHPARLRVGWDTGAPGFEPRVSRPPSQRSKGLRLPPGKGERLLRMQAASLPGALAGSWSGRSRRIELTLFADQGVVEIEGIEIFEAREGYLLEASEALATATPAALYFDEFDRLPSPVHTDVPLLTAVELRSLRPARGLFRAGRFERAGDREGMDRPIVFRKGGAFLQTGPHSAPRPSEILWDGRPVGKPLEVALAVGQGPAESIAFWIRGEGDWSFPGRGCLGLPEGNWFAGSPDPRGTWGCGPGPAVEYEIWTSLPYLARGPGWTHTDSFDTPVLTDLFLTKGAGPDTPFFRGRESLFRADEAMGVKLTLARGAAQKLLVNVRLRGEPGAGPHEVVIPAGRVQLPLAVRLLPYRLPPERDAYVEWKQNWLIGDPSGRCDFEDPATKAGAAPMCSLPDAGTAATYRICAEDFPYLARRIREHSIKGVQLWPSFGCTGGVEQCGPGRPEIRGARCTDSVFKGYVQGIAAAWGRALGKDQLGPGDGWIAVSPGAAWGGPAWPYCCTLDPGGSCPCDKGSGRDPCPPNSAVAAMPGARAWAAIREVLATGLGAYGYLAGMDEIFGWGHQRTAALAVTVRSFHDAGARGLLNWYAPDRNQTWADRVARAAVDTGHFRPEECVSPCDIEGWKDRSVHDAERILRWGAWDGGGTCPGKAAHGWSAMGSEIVRQMMLADLRGPGTYCTKYRVGPAVNPRNPCDVTGECEDGAALDCDDPALRGTKRPPWCPEYREVPDPRQEIGNVTYTIGGDWLLALQEECQGREGCPFNRPDREEQGTFEGVYFKWPPLWRFSAGFWSGASNLDAFHPYHVFEGVSDEGPLLPGGAAVETFSNWNWPLHNPGGLVYIAASRPAPPGETCEGGCSGVVMTEGFEALRAGYTDIRWWDALQAFPVDEPACRELKREMEEWVRDRVFPFGVGRGTPHRPGTKGSWLTPLRLDGSYWAMPGYVSEACSDEDLSRMRRVVIETLDRLDRAGSSCLRPYPFE